jgi:hypothetical protein
MDPLESFTVTQWIIFTVFIFLYVFPIAMILRRAGFSAWWCLLAFSGPFVVVGLWVFAAVRWPIEKRLIIS